MSLIYKLLARDAWDAAVEGGVFNGSAVDLADGYIHFSTADQAQETARLHFAGQADLVVLVVAAEALGDGLKWEPSRGGQLFPHLYGVLPTSKVDAVRPLSLGADGDSGPVGDRALNPLYATATRALRTLDAETAHRLTLHLLRAGLGPRPSRAETPDLAVDLAGLKLDNPIGLAAGFDKDAEVCDAMLAAGFGMVECGAVTPLPQAGNPRPRLFRLHEDRAVINRMGFNNKGLEAFASNLAARRRLGVVGANIGANKDSADRIGDYVAGLERLWGLADYFVINVSSPNTPGLRGLQTRQALEGASGPTDAGRQMLSRDDGNAPIFLKVAPDLDDDEDRSHCRGRLGVGSSGPDCRQHNRHPAGGAQVAVARRGWRPVRRAADGGLDGGAEAVPPGRGRSPGADRRGRGGRRRRRLRQDQGRRCGRPDLFGHGL